jgi:hypothetical protein
MVLDDEELSAFTAKSFSPSSLEPWRVRSILTKPISARQLMNAHYSFKSEISRTAEKSRGGGRKKSCKSRHL